MRRERRERRLRRDEMSRVRQEESEMDGEKTKARREKEGGGGLRLGERQVRQS